MSSSSVTEAVERARAAWAVDDHEGAKEIARTVTPDVDPVQDATAGWRLAELLVEMGDEDAGLGLATRLATANSSTTAALRRVALLLRTERAKEAGDVLRQAALEHGSTIEIMGTLVELALSALGWQVLDGLPPPAPAVARMVDLARRRADGFSPPDMDSRRMAYVLARVVVLGGSEDEEATVAPYWFMNADEYEVAWFLRRLLAWLHSEGIQPSSVRPANDAAEPIAIALATRLRIPCQTTAVDEPGGIRLYSSLEQLDNAPPSQARDVVTICLGIEEPPGWRALLARSTVDAVGVFAPLEISWSDADADEPARPLPSAQEIADRILAEERTLPRDSSLKPMRRFYQRHRLRTWDAD